MKQYSILSLREKIGQTVDIYGWVATKRDHKNIVFLDIRDRTGIVQVVGSNEFASVSPEDIVLIKGLVKERPERLINPNIPTGTIEIEGQSVEILSSSDTVPFPLDTDGYDLDEELRLQYRYLDLRRTRMMGNMKRRSDVLLWIRNFLHTEEFIEMETPILTKSTPEGARDFLVPARLQPGKFYALPQSPQQYKQMLMVAGVEKYFQLARCFRDEDPRADRAYGEFTQLDMELSFVTQEDILTLTERMFIQMVKELFPEKKLTFEPFHRMSHAEAQEKYQTDKPDLRKDKQDSNELAFCWILDYPLFTTQSEDDYFHGSGASKFAPSHHMFTSPHPDDVALLDTDPGKVRGLQHDLVLNGFEVGGGSIRIHDSAIQQKVFDIIGFSEAQKNQFSYMLKAFSYGVPPHGGIAPGIDRLLMVLLGEPSLREVIAFPMTSGGKTAIMDAPSIVSDTQLAEVSISVHAKAKEAHK